jgi:hypothetical protein
MEGLSGKVTICGSMIKYQESRIGRRVYSVNSIRGIGMEIMPLGLSVGTGIPSRLYPRLPEHIYMQEIIKLSS